jgi:hypothetical protein
VNALLADVAAADMSVAALLWRQMANAERLLAATSSLIVR